MPSILFVCTANQFRSPIAAACLRQVLSQTRPGEDWTVESAGTWAQTGLPAPIPTLQISKRLSLTGLDRHLTRQVDNKLLERFDLAIVMETGHKEALAIEFPTTRSRIYMLSEIVDGSCYDIADPAGPDADLGQVATELQGLIRKGTDRILQLAQLLHHTKPVFNPEQI